LPGILLDDWNPPSDVEQRTSGLRARRESGDDPDLHVTAPRVPTTPVTHVGHVSGKPPPNTFVGVPPGVDDAGKTEPTMPKLELPLRAPPTNPPPGQDPQWSSLAARVDAALDTGDEWQIETPVVAPTKAELRALLGAPDPTRKQSVDELERLHRAVADDVSEPELLPQRRFPNITNEVDPDDIEAAIEIAPPARRTGSIAVAKPKKPE
jgi:hypothetical protein